MLEIARDDKFLTRKQAAEYLRRRGCAVSYGYLKNLATHANSGNGPVFFRNRGRIAYREIDLETWWRQNMQIVGAISTVYDR